MKQTSFKHLEKILFQFYLVEGKFRHMEILFTKLRIFMIATAMTKKLMTLYLKTKL